MFGYRGGRPPGKETLPLRQLLIAPPTLREVRKVWSRAPRPALFLLMIHRLHLGTVRCVLCSLLLPLASFGESNSNSLPALPEALGSKVDLWGEAAMRQTNGASYEFFKNL